MAWNGSGGTALPKVKAKEKGKISKAITGLLLALIAVVVLATWCGTGSSEATDEGAGTSGAKVRLRHAGRRDRQRPEDAVRDAMPAKVRNGETRKKKPVHRAPEMFAHLSGEDRRMAELVQAAMDEDDFEALKAAAGESLKSANPEVRMNAVDALGWFGAQALPELAGAMADADDDIRQTAESHFEQALHEVDNPVDQFKIAMAAFGSLTSEDQLTSLGGLINNVTTELVDNEDDLEIAAENRLAICQSLVDIIDGEALPQNVDAAKDLYNDITGNEWQGIEEAEKYLENPDGYDPNGEEETPSEVVAETPVEGATETPSEGVAETPVEDVQTGRSDAEKPGNDADENVENSDTQDD